MEPSNSRLEWTAASAGLSRREVDMVRGSGSAATQPLSR